MGRTKIKSVAFDDETLNAVEIIMAYYRVNRSTAVRLAVQYFAKMLQTQQPLPPPPPPPQWPYLPPYRQ